MAEANISVEVEASIHRGIKAECQRIANEYGIAIQDVRVQWTTIPRVVGGAIYIADEVQLTTSFRQSPKGSHDRI